MKQITIYDLLPLLKKGWVCCDPHGSWKWFRKKPYVFKGLIENFISTDVLDFPEFFPRCFNIKPFKGDWKDSLIKVEHSKKKSIDRKDFDDFMEQHGVSPWGFLTEAILKEDFECWKKRRRNDKDTN